jgi:hypothetical protein
VRDEARSKDAWKKQLESVEGRFFEVVERGAAP